MLKKTGSSLTFICTLVEEHGLVFDRESDSDKTSFCGPYFDHDMESYGRFTKQHILAAGVGSGAVVSGGYGHTHQAWRRGLEMVRLQLKYYHHHYYYYYYY